MKPWLRSLSVSVFCAAALGAAAGAVVAAREIAPERYLAAGLWRTALWTLSRGSLLGAGLGAAGAAIATFVLAGWPAVVRRASRPTPQFASGFVLLVAGCAAVVSATAPVVGPDRLGLGYPSIAAACVAAFVLIASAAAAAPGEESPSLAAAVWPLVVGAASLVGVLHLLARVESAQRAAVSVGAVLLAGLVAYWALQRYAERLVHRLARPLGRLGMRRAGWALAVLGGCAVALWAASGVIGIRARAAAHRTGLNIVVIAVDTLRWDAVSLLSADEHPRDLTPNLRRLLGTRAAVFRNAYSQAPWTLPSFASILTGLYPEQHGAEHFISKLSPEQVTIAELLREAGYATASVVSGHFVSAEVGMAQGFEVYDGSQIPDAARLPTSAEVTDRACRFVARHARERFFLFAHYFDPHHLYLDHPEYDFVRPSLGPALSGPANAKLVLQSYAGRPLTEEERENVRGLYDEEVAYTDSQIARLLAFLDDAGLRDSTCIILVADHGEEFLDHGSTGHDKTLFQELVHVPLAVADPRRPSPEVIDRPVETRFLFGTMLDAAHVSLPRRPRPPTLFDPTDSGEPRVRSATHPMPGEGEGPTAGVWLTCLATARHKLIADHVSGSVTLFDLAADPAETHNLNRDMPELASHLTQALETWNAEVRAGSPAPSQPRLSERELRRIKDLGYL